MQKEVSCENQFLDIRGNTFTKYSLEWQLKGQPEKTLLVYLLWISWLTFIL